MLTAANLEGLDHALQFQRIRDAFQAGELSQPQAVELSVHCNLPEEMREALRNSKLVTVGYGEQGFDSRIHYPLPESSPVFAATRSASPLQGEQDGERPTLAPSYSRVQQPGSRLDPRREAL